MNMKRRWERWEEGRGILTVGYGLNPSWVLMSFVGNWALMGLCQREERFYFYFQFSPLVLVIVVILLEVLLCVDEMGLLNFHFPDNQLWSSLPPSMESETLNTQKRVKNAVFDFKHVKLYTHFCHFKYHLEIRF